MIERNARYPKMEYNAAVDEFQATEYPMLQGKTYLDHGGTTVYAKSLIDAFSTSLLSNLYGNPHSASNPAKLSLEIVNETREQTLRFFGADPEHFDLIFVANATAAIKLVMESFRDLSTADGATDPGFWYGYHVDAHNSLVGVRECSEDYHLFSTDAEVEAWLSPFSSTSTSTSTSINPAGRLGIFAYPGQSNMTGRRLPLNWASAIRRSTNPAHTDTYTLLDAAALATTAPLHPVFADPDAAPDFTCLSFYKIFGFPDLGGLIVRKASGRILSCRRYFGGGTVNLVTVAGAKPWVEKREEVLHENLEDGTLPFHSIIALKAAIETHERLYGGEDGEPCMSVISRHTAFLGKRLFDGLSGLKHGNGAPMIKIYTGASGESVYGDARTQGATVSFNVLRDDGSYVPYTSAVERAANAQEICVRSGQLCNPGGIGMHLGLEKWHVLRLWQYGHRCGGHENSGTEIFHGRPTGVVRVSMGAMTTMSNVDSLIAFLRDEYFTETTIGSPMERRGMIFERPLTLEEGIALVIREKDSDSFSEISEEGHGGGGSTDFGSHRGGIRVGMDVNGGRESETDSVTVPGEALHGELRGFEIVPRSYSSSPARRVNTATALTLTTPKVNTEVTTNGSVVTMNGTAKLNGTLTMNEAAMMNGAVTTNGTGLMNGEETANERRMINREETMNETRMMNGEEMMNGTGMLNRETMNGTEMMNRETMNGTEMMNRETMNGTEMMNRETMNGTAMMNRETMNGTEMMNRETMNGTAMMNRETMNGTAMVNRETMNTMEMMNGGMMMTGAIPAPEDEITVVSPITPAPQEKRRPVVHVISVQEFEMSRSKIVIRPSTGKPMVPKKEDMHGLKRLLSTKIRVRKSSSALGKISMQI